MPALTTERLVEDAKDRLFQMEDLRESPQGLHEYMLNMETCYQAMLNVQDYKWRSNHQLALSTARNTLAEILGVDKQVIQDYYETIATRER